MSLLHIQLRGLFNITRLHPGCLTILGKTTHSSFTAVPSIGYALSAIIYTQIMRAKSAKHMGRLLSAQCLLRSPELFYSIVSSFCHLILCSSDVLIHILSLTSYIIVLEFPLKSKLSHWRFKGKFYSDPNTLRAMVKEKRIFK